MDAMIKSLHRKFIAVATAAVFLIVAVAIGVIHGMLHFTMVEENHSVLDHLVENNGVLSEDRRPVGEGWLLDDDWSGNVPEFYYQIRYFSVLLDAEGTAKVVNVNHISAFDAKSALETALKASRSGDTEGYFEKGKAHYVYRVARTGDDVLVVILDCTRDVRALQSALKYEALFGIGCVLLFVGVMTLFSRRAIAPFIQNAENQKRFITNAGHELKTPVAIISANAEALELIGGKNEWTGNILKQVRRLTLLINDLIMLSKVGETSEKDIVLVDTDMTNTVSQGAEGFRSLIEGDGKQLETDIAENVTVKAEPKFLAELINILLDNAAKYCDEEGTIRVALSKKKNGKGAVLDVSNKYAAGKGVDYGKFFERFYRGDSSHNSEKAGYGIGLSMAADMVKLMHGRIEVLYANETITFRVTM